MKWDEEAIAAENRTEKFLDVVKDNLSYLEKYEDGTSEIYAPSKFNFSFRIRDLFEQKKIDVEKNNIRTKIFGTTKELIRNIGTEKYYASEVQISSEFDKNLFTYTARIESSGWKLSDKIDIGLDDTLIQELVATLNNAKHELQLVIEVDKEFIYRESRLANSQNRLDNTVDLRYCKDCVVAEDLDNLQNLKFFTINTQAKIISIEIYPSFKF